jgi:hypothetical protein
MTAEQPNANTAVEREAIARIVDDSQEVWRTVDDWAVFWRKTHAKVREFTPGVSPEQVEEWVARSAIESFDSFQKARDTARGRADAILAALPRQQAVQAAGAEERALDNQFIWTVPRHPTEAMMEAGLYHCSADMEWADLFTAFHAMVDAAAQDDRGHDPMQAADAAGQSAAPAPAGDEVRAALEPFAWVGQWLFARDLPDETPMVTIQGIGRDIALTRGMFKKAHTVLAALSRPPTGKSVEPKEPGRAA